MAPGLGAFHNAGPGLGAITQPRPLASLGTLIVLSSVLRGALPAKCDARELIRSFRCAVSQQISKDKNMNDHHGRYIESY